MKHSKLIIVGLMAVGIASYFIFDLGQYLSLDAIQSQLESLREYRDNNLALSIAAYFLIYIAVTALSLPGAALLTLLGGALFGLLQGTIIVSFASTIGATLAFLAARLVLGDTVRNRFARAFESIDRGMDREGPFYLFTLRLIPIFPFFVINLVMGLTRIRVLTFALVSQAGMLPGTLAYVNAGQQLGQIRTAGDIVAPGLVLSFVAIGLLPLVANRAIDAWRRRQVFRRWTRPQSIDRNLIVIGGGAAGLVTSYIAAAVKAKVTLVAAEKMGGDCLYTGCVPSKSLIRSARFMHDVRRHQDLGIESATARVDLGQVMDRVQRIISAIEPHDSPERYEGLGVECISGHAKLVSPWEVEVNGERLSAANIVIATGGKPMVPPIHGIEEVEFLTSDTLWKLRELPGRLTVLGGGPIGCEMAQAFARLGSEVTLVEMAERILEREDPDASACVASSMMNDGVRLLVAHRAERVQPGQLLCTGPDGEVTVPFDQLLVAVGRRANTQGLGIEELGLNLRRNGTLEVNDYLQTRYPNIFACGDVISPYQFTHSASHEAWYCAVNALFGRFRKFRADYKVLPWVTFTDPEVARVGLNQSEAQASGKDHQVTVYPLTGLDRALAEEAAHGFVKVVTRGDSDTIIGATVVGDHGGEILAELTLAMKHGIGLKKLMGTIHPYPTWTEAAKFTAGRWREANKPEKLMPWLAKFHAWQRR
ncbi:MAG: FAD-dependent oxidoreductase [Xanthomonadales bacterium]|nr:FAD-dependent oxidoreductase [Xanthomonadales bacterium]